MNVWIDGEQVPSGAIAVQDLSFLRGDGCFEALRSYHGQVFAVDEHLQRLTQSAEALALPLPDTGLLAEWVRRAGAVSGDGVIRLIATRGDPERGLMGAIVVMAEPLPPPRSELRMMSVGAPWHSAGRAWDLAGAKTLSYAPNLSASRRARAAGFDDAVLLSDESVVLEGPTFTVGWLVGEVLETPDLDLLILDSITRRHVVAAAEECGIVVEEGRFPLERMYEADEVFAMSTVKEVTPVTRIDAFEKAPGPVTSRVRDALHARIANLLNS